MKIKKTIVKYIYAIIPMILLISCALVLKALDGNTDALSETAFRLVMILLVIAPSVSLILELIGLVKAVRSYKFLDDDEPYSVKRNGIRYISLFAGAMLFTVLWLSSIIYIIFQYMNLL